MCVATFTVWTSVNYGKRRTWGVRWREERGGESKEVKLKDEWKRGESDFFIIKPSLMWAAAPAWTHQTPSPSGPVCTFTYTFDHAVHPTVPYFWHGRYFCVSFSVSVCPCVKMWCDRDECGEHVTFPTRWQGRVLTEGQTFSSSDRHLSCVPLCVRASVLVPALSASWRKHEDMQTKLEKAMLLFIFSSSSHRLCVSAAHLYAYVYMSFIAMFCVCVCVRVCMLLSVWWGVYMINTRQAWEEFWSGALQQLLWKQY